MGYHRKGGTHVGSFPGIKSLAGKAVPLCLPILLLFLLFLSDIGTQSKSTSQ